jgi:hypothetical protein
VRTRAAGQRGIVIIAFNVVIAMPVLLAAHNSLYRSHASVTASWCRALIRRASNDTSSQHTYAVAAE